MHGRFGNKFPRPEHSLTATIAARCAAIIWYNLIQCRPAFPKSRIYFLEEKAVFKTAVRFFCRDNDCGHMQFIPGRKKWIQFFCSGLPNGLPFLTEVPSHEKTDGSGSVFLWLCSCLHDLFIFNIFSADKTNAFLLRFIYGYV